MTLIIFLIFVPLLAFVLLAVNLVFAPHNPYQEKSSAFECGFHSFLGQNRTQFNISFFIFALLFLLFDLEIILVYPYIVSGYLNGIYGLVTMLIFLLVLTLGFVYELGKNALKLENRQTYSLKQNITEIVSLSSYNPPKPHLSVGLPLNSDYLPLLISIIEVLLLTLPVLFVVAFVTIAERKTMASMQRRLGPNIVGYYGLLQAFADALKLLLKEYVSPTQSNFVLFFIGPIITLIFSLIGYAVIPFGPGISISDLNLGILYMLAVSSLSTYGILLAGWSANSKYAFLGSLRSTAQLISYELILSSAIILVVLLTGSLNLSVNVEAQNTIWYVVPLLPVFIIFYIGSVAETNRAPFDLAEAESELVSGFMTEHAAVIFVFFFLAEYASIVLICILTSLLFLGGYLYDYISLFYIMQYIDFDYYITSLNNYESLNYNSLYEGIAYGLSLGLKTCIMIFVFI